VSISIKTCPACGQVNPGFHEFCPVCGANLDETPKRAAPWTLSARFPPLAAAVDPDRRRRRRQPVPDGRGVGLAWIGAALVVLPVATSNRSTLGLASWCAGILMITFAFWQMRRDRYTLARAGAVTNGVAVLALVIIGTMLVRTDNGHRDDLKSAAANVTPTTTQLPDWAVPTKAASPTANVAMYRGNAAHTGELPGPGITGRPYRVWRFDTAGEIYSSPAVVNGLVYIGSKSGFLFALDAGTGDERWRANLGDYIVRSSPAVVDSQVYIGAGYSLFSLDATTGDETWRGRTSFSGSSSPSFFDGTVFVASQSSSVYAFDAATGKTKWSFQTDGPVFSSPAVTSDLVFVGTDNGKLLALSIKSGQTRWRFDTEGGIFSSPAVAGDLVYVTSKGGKTYALEIATGKLRWSYDAGGEASPAVSGGTLFVAGADGGLYALDAATGGDPKWLFPTGSPITTSPVVAAGVVYVASGTTLYAIDAQTGSEVWRYAAGYRIDTSPVVVNGYIFIGGKDGFLDAITGDGSG
jgi:outer membrane protein assembly factor BamB